MHSVSCHTTIYLKLNTQSEASSLNWTRVLQPICLKLTTKLPKEITNQFVAKFWSILMQRTFFSLENWDSYSSFDKLLLPNLAHCGWGLKYISYCGRHPASSSPIYIYMVSISHFREAGLFIEGAGGQGGTQYSRGHSPLLRSVPPLDVTLSLDPVPPEIFCPLFYHS